MINIKEEVDSEAKMKNFVVEGKNKFFFFIKHGLYCLFIWLFSFLTIIFINKLYGKIIFGLSGLATLFYLFSLKTLYQKNTEYLEEKQVFEDDKNEFVKIFQKTFVCFLLPGFILVFGLNLAIFHNLLAHLLFLFFGYLLFFIYINIKLFGILIARKKRWKF